MDIKCKCWFCVYNKNSKLCEKNEIEINSQGCCNNFKSLVKDIEEDKNIEKIKFLSKVLYGVQNFNEVISNPDLDRLVK